MITPKYFMMILLITLIVSYSALAQGPGKPFHPMTAPGANGVALSGHILVWENPLGTVYNEVYFSLDSSLVASLDTTTRIVNGYPSTTSNSIDLTFIFLDHFTKYYWRVVEHDSSDFTTGPIWYFISRIDASLNIIVFDDFEDQTLTNWDISNDGGDCMWTPIELATRPYTMPPDAFGWGMTADSDLCGSGSTFLSTATMNFGIDATQGFGYLFIFIEFDHDWRTISAADEAYVEVTLDGGATWTEVVSWIGVDAREEHYISILFSTNLSTDIRFRFRVIQPGWDWWWAIDNVSITLLLGPLSFAFPPNYLAVFADTTEQRVLINWDAGSSPDPISGYRLQRKDGLPADSTIYVTITETDANTFSYSDYGVQLNQDYTYRIQTLSGPGPGGSIWGNEATAYVTKIIPVELTSFTASVSGNDVQLNWSTATELNNLGFEILRSTNKDEWNKIGFVPGNGTTTEQQHYSFIDESVSSGKYQYRLKQIDYDGTFEYSDIVELEVGLPTVFSLEQNYPNPFNPSTKINYKISELSLVTLKIYDVLGNEIAILVNKEKPAGSYEIEFYATALTSGIYFYRLQAGNFVETKKLVLMK